MNEIQRGVLEFHKATDSVYEDTPKLPHQSIIALRLALIDEELSELNDAFEAGNLVKIADAIGDLLYVVYGTAVACGIDMEPISREIQRSNMTKVGGPVRGDGKVLKPDDFNPPNLRPIIDKQIYHELEDSALDKQVGGSHYKSYSIQPYEFFVRNEIPYHKAAIIKRILRYDHPTGGGLTDLEKIKHEVDLIITLG